MWGGSSGEEGRQGRLVVYWGVWRGANPDPRPLSATPPRPLTRECTPSFSHHPPAPPCQALLVLFFFFAGMIVRSHAYMWLLPTMACLCACASRAIHITSLTLAPFYGYGLGVSLLGGGTMSVSAHAAAHIRHHLTTSSPPYAASCTASAPRAPPHHLMLPHAPSQHRVRPHASC